jgi:hypothetical protein
MFEDAFKYAVVAGIPLLVLTIGLVQFIKGFGLSGRLVRLLSAGVGLLLGFGYHLSRAPMPTDFAGWFEVLVFGLAVGVSASGLYDANQG